MHNSTTVQSTRRIRIVQFTVEETYLDTCNENYKYYDNWRL